MFGLISAAIAIGLGAMAGYGLARWSPHWALTALVVLGGAASAFWIGGELSKGEVFQVTTALLRGLEDQEASPLETVSALPLVAATGFFDLIGGTGRALFWAFFGAILWLVGLLLGSVLGRRGKTT
jgi:hypothetical protein